MKRSIGALFIFLVLLSSCSKSNKDLIVGKWKCVNLTSESEAALSQLYLNLFNMKEMPRVSASDVKKLVDNAVSEYKAFKFNFTEEGKYSYYYRSDKETFRNMGFDTRESEFSENIEDNGEYTLSENGETITLRCFDKRVNDWTKTDYKILYINKDSLILQEQSPGFKVSMILKKHTD